jgi:hypothetical protein
MSGSSINESIVGTGQSQQETFEPETDYIPPRRGFNVEWLKAETGEGDVEDYLNHPLNASNNRFLAQILRGLTGMFGSMRFAVADIIIGVMDYMKERKKEAVPNVDQLR